MFWLFGGIPEIGKKINYSGHLKINVIPFCQYCHSKPEDLPMPLAFLGALLLLLFLFPQWRQAVGRRPKAQEQINLNSRDTKKGVQQYTSTAESSHFGGLTFSFSSSVQTFFSSSSPWAGGRALHQRRGCKQRQSRGGHLCVHSSDGKWNVKSQLEEFSGLKSTFLGCKLQLGLCWVLKSLKKVIVSFIFSTK